MSQAWIRRYFDTRSKSAQGVLAQVAPAFVDLDHRRAADARREPGGGARLQVAARARSRMKSLLWLVLVFAAAAALAVFGRTNARATRCSSTRRGGSRFRCCSGIVALLLTFALLYTATRLIGTTRSTFLPAQVRAYRQRRNATAHRARSPLHWQAYLEGRFVRAEREAQACDRPSRAGSPRCSGPAPRTSCAMPNGAGSGSPARKTARHESERAPRFPRRACARRPRFRRGARDPVLAARERSAPRSRRCAC